MTITNNDTDDFEDVAGLLATALPGLRCLRCGNENFYLLDSAYASIPKGDLTDEKRPVTKLACTRCGLIEEHLTGVLRNSFKTERRPLAEPDK